MNKVLGVGEEIDQCCGGWGGCVGGRNGGGGGGVDGGKKQTGLTGQETDWGKNWPVTLGQGHFWPKGYNLNNLGRGLLGEAMYQISKAWAFWLQIRRFLKVFSI